MLENMKDVVTDEKTSSVPNSCKNKEGYTNIPEYIAIRNDHEAQRHNKLIRTILYICNLAGFYVEGRIVLVDKYTGRVWR